MEDNLVVQLQEITLIDLHDSGKKKYSCLGLICCFLAGYRASIILGILSHCLRGSDNR